MVAPGSTSLLRPNVENWRMTALTDLATALATANNQTFQVNIDQPTKYFAGLGTSWQGDAYNAAYDRVGQDHDQARKVWTYIDDLVTAIHQAAGDIDSHRTILLNKVGDARAHGLTVADNWVIPDKDGVPVATINILQDAINQAFYPFRDAVADAATKISEAAELIRAAGDLFGSDVDVADAPAAGKRLGAEDGQEAADAARSGDKTKLDEVASHLPTNVLTPQQMQDLEDGKDVPSLPADVQDYYKQFFQHAGKDGVLALQDHLQQEATATADHPASTVAATRQTALADGMMAISNEHLGTGTGPDGKLTSAGAYTNLSPDLRAVLSGREEDLNGNGASNIDAARQRMLDRSRLANLLSKSDQTMTGGTTFSMETARQAASMAHYIDSATTNGAMPPGFQDHDKATIDNAANQLLGVGTRNHDADYQLMTGLDAHVPGQKIPADLSFGATGNQFAPHGAYDPQKFNSAVFDHQWADQGKAASGLYDWAADHTNDQDPQGVLARKTIGALPEVFAPKHGESLDFASDGKTYFQHSADDFNRNPELANALSRVSASDINAFGNLGGASNAPQPVVPLDTQDSERLAFLASQTQEGQHTLDQARQTYDDGVMFQLSHDDTLPKTTVHDTVGQLGALDAHIDDSIRNAQIYHDHNTVAEHNQQAQAAHDDTQKWADNAKKLADNIPLPGGKVTGTVKSVLEDPAYQGLMNDLNPQPTPEKVQYSIKEDAQNDGMEDFRHRIDRIGVSPNDIPEYQKDHDDQYSRVVADGLVTDNNSLDQLATGGAQAPENPDAKNAGK